MPSNLRNIENMTACQLAKGYATHPLLHQAFASGGRIFCACLLLLTLGFAACTEDSPEAQNPYDTTRTAADSTAAGDNIVVPPIQVDPTWADTLYYDYDGHPCR